MEDVELRLLDSSFNDIALIDAYTSLSWSDKYNEYGEFELVLPLTEENVSLFEKDMYMWKNNTEHMMIIDEIEIDEGVTSAGKLKISGKSLESLLQRRIIWDKKEYADNYNVCSLIFDIITKSIAGVIRDSSGTETPSYPEPDSEYKYRRRIENFVLDKTIPDSIKSYTYEKVEYEGDNVYEIIQTICSEKKIGFKVVLDDQNRFVFSLYTGTDRSVEQTDYDQIVFSSEYDNLQSVNYIESYADYKNVCRFKGSTTLGEYDTGDDTGVGISRREVYASDSDITATDATTLRTKAREELEDYLVTTAIDGDIYNNIMFVYRKDYFVGDWVTFMNKYGKIQKSRITEMLMSVDSQGAKFSPTFVTKEEEDKDIKTQLYLVRNGTAQVDWVRNSSNGEYVAGTGFRQYYTDTTGVFHPLFNKTIQEALDAGYTKIVYKINSVYGQYVNLGTLIQYKAYDYKDWVFHKPVKLSIGDNILTFNLADDYQSHNGYVGCCFCASASGMTPDTQLLTDLYFVK